MIGKELAARRFSRYYPWILSAVILFYFLTFPIFRSPILVVIPVLIAGWFYSGRAALAASLFSLFINLVLVQVFVIGRGQNTAAGVLPGLLVGTIFLILTSAGAGYLRSLLEDLYRREELLRSEERFLTLLGIIIKKILSHSSWNALDDRNSNLLYLDIVHHLTNLFVADRGHLIRLDADSAAASLAASTNAADLPPSSDELDPREIRIAVDALQTGRILVIDDLADSAYGGGNDSMVRGGSTIHSVLCIPLTAREFRFGAAILSYQDRHRFAPEEIKYAERIGHQVALALWGLRQDQVNVQQLNETLIMMKIGQALSERERIGLDTVLQLIADSARQLILQAEMAVIHLMEDDGPLVARATSGAYRNPGQTMYPGAGAAGQVLRDGTTLNIADACADRRFLPAEGQPACRSLLVAPVQSAGKRLGTISVESQSPRAFSEHEAKLLEALGNQAAIAIENSRLFEATARSLEELSALYRINQRLTASLDADTLIKEVVDLLEQSFHYYHVQVYLIDPERQECVLRQASGEIGARLQAMGHRLLPGQGIVGHVAETAEPFLTNEVETVAFFVRNPLLPETKSELAVPIRIEQGVLGVLDIQQGAPRRLSERDLQVASAVTEQLAIALQKAGLYVNLQAALQHEQAMRAQLLQSERLALMGKLLASVSHELNNPLQTIQNALFLIRDDLRQSSIRLEEMDIISDEIDRMVTLLERLRSTYRPLPREEFSAIRIPDLIGDVHKLMSTHLRHRDIDFEFRAAPHLPAVAGQADHLKQVALNLFINAVEAMPQGGCLCVDVCASPAGGEVVICVTDNGTGIEADILPRIFDPFVTSKKTGTGLGLTITYEIVEQHGGRILAENIPAGGARFTVWLPAWKERAG